MHRSCPAHSSEREVSICVVQDTEEEVSADPWPAALLWRGDLIQLGNGKAKTQLEVPGHEGHRGLAWDQRLCLSEGGCLTGTLSEGLLERNLKAKISGFHGPVTLQKLKFEEPTEDCQLSFFCQIRKL